LRSFAILSDAFASRQPLAPEKRLPEMPTIFINFARPLQQVVQRVL
jgi:hypothetical protein